MENDGGFFEQQRFTQKWIISLMVAINVIPIYAVYSQIILGEPFGNKLVSDTGIGTIAAATLLFTFFFFSQKLQTKIKSDGIYVRFFPYHLSYRHYDWNNISKMFVRKYRPVIEFGGWGIRFGFSGKGKALNVSGNMGLQLIFSDNKKLLIGTNKPDELQAALAMTGQPAYQLHEE